MGANRRDWPELMPVGRSAICISARNLSPSFLRAPRKTAFFLNGSGRASPPRYSVKAMARWLIRVPDRLEHARRGAKQRLEGPINEIKQQVPGFERRAEFKALVDRTGLADAYVQHAVLSWEAAQPSAQSLDRHFPDGFTVFWVPEALSSISTSFAPNRLCYSHTARLMIIIPRWRTGPGLESMNAESVTCLCRSVFMDCFAADALAPG
jgi:hypothetical protein